MLVELNTHANTHTYKHTCTHTNTHEMFMHLKHSESRLLNRHIDGFCDLEDSQDSCAATDTPLIT